MKQKNLLLDGQTAIVTGGASGIGLATVKVLSSVGAHVIIADTNKELGHDLYERFKSEGKKVGYIYCDISSEASISELGKKIIAARIGIIFHTTYNDLSGGGASFGADISGLSESTDVWFDDAYFKDSTGILLSDKEEKFVLDKINEADSVNVVLSAEFPASEKFAFTVE